MARPPKKAAAKAAAGRRPAPKGRKKPEAGLDFSDSGDELDAFQKQRDRVGLDLSDEEGLDGSEDEEEAVMGLSASDFDSSDLDDDIEAGGRIGQRAWGWRGAGAGRPPHPACRTRAAASSLQPSRDRDLHACSIARYIPLFAIGRCSPF